MPYLTYDEFKGYSDKDIDETEFNKLIKKASDVLNYVTRDFYVFQNLETDNEYRKTKFKKAVAAQIDYFYDMGATSSHELNNPLSVQIGRTQMSMGERNQQNVNKFGTTSDDVYLHLQGTGLLYRGIGVV